MKSIVGLIILAFALGFNGLNVNAAEQGGGGIGLMLGIDKTANAPKIMRVIPNSPAAKANLTPGSIVKKIGDVSTQGKSMAECVALIRGPIGSKLTLEVQAPGENSAKQIELSRDKVAAPEKAKVGDPASPLMIAEWIQGGPVDINDGKGLSVVEFWATWCGPCRVSIPHLNEMQKKLKDKGVRFVGISDEAPATVKAFVKKMGSQMEYAVACDDSRQTFVNYMTAYGHNGIPTAFLVGKDGRVLWHGHPMGGLEQALQKFLEEKPKL